MISRNKKESIKGIELSGGKCIVCGWCAKDKSGNSLVEGAHVRPVESGKEYDGNDNIIALCPNHHAEYDAYNFYIDVYTRELHFRDATDKFNGVNVEVSTRHIKPAYLAYKKYLYDKYNER